MSNVILGAKKERCNGGLGRVRWNGKKAAQTQQKQNVTKLSSTPMTPVYFHLLNRSRCADVQMCEVKRFTKMTEHVSGALCNKIPLRAAHSSQKSLTDMLV